MTSADKEQAIQPDVLSWVSANPEAAKGLAEGTMVAVPRDSHDTNPLLPKLGGEFKETAAGFTRRFRLDDPALDEYLGRDDPNAPDGVF